VGAGRCVSGVLLCDDDADVDASSAEIGNEIRYMDKPESARMEILLDISAFRLQTCRAVRASPTRWILGTIFLLRQKKKGKIDFQVFSSRNLLIIHEMAKECFGIQIFKLLISLIPAKSEIWKSK
jgi:hypothetical protein